MFREFSWFRSLIESCRSNVWDEIHAELRQQKSKQVIIWIHAASVGETKAVAPLIQHFIQQSNYKVIVTNRSAKALKWKIPEVDDFILGKKRLIAPNEFRMNEFLTKTNPQLAILVESELWPCLIIKTKRQTPLILVNGRISENSFAKWNANFLSQFLIRFLLGKLDLVSCQTEPDVAKFQQLSKNHTKMLICNMKRITEPKLLTTVDPELKAFLDSIPEKLQSETWAAISLHPNEEEVLIRAHKEFVATCNVNSNLLLIPRHPNEEQSYNGHISQIDANIFRIDQMGVVSQTCKWISSKGKGIVFVGGSLTASSHKGGHNIFEPLRCGCAVIHGPHIDSFRNLITTIPNGRFRFEADTPNDIAGVLKRMFSPASPEEIELRKAQAGGEEQRFKHVCEEIDKLLEAARK